MKKLMFILAIASFLMSAGYAGAAVVLFDDLTPGQYIEGMHLGNAFPDGVRFTSADTFSTHVVGPGVYEGVGYYSPFNAITNYGWMANNALIMTFDAPRGYLHFRVGDQGGDQDQVIVKAYDKNGGLIGSWDSGLFGGNDVNYSGPMVDVWSFTEYLPHMKVVTIESIGPGAGVGLDDLVFCHPEPVPVPAAVWLLGSGLVGLIGLRRKLTK